MTAAFHFVSSSCMMIEKWDYVEDDCGGSKRNFALDYLFLKGVNLWR